MTDGDVLVHEPLAVAHRQKVPVACLHEWIDEEERPLAGDDLQPPPFLRLVYVLVDVLRMLGHGEVRVRDVEIAAELRLVDRGHHLLERIHVVPDTPDHETDPSLQPESRTTRTHTT